MSKIQASPALAELRSLVGEEAVRSQPVEMVLCSIKCCEESTSGNWAGEFGGSGPAGSVVRVPSVEAAF